MRPVARLFAGVVLVAMAGCASHHDDPGPAAPPDAAPVATGPFTVSVTNSSQGIATSDPPGISCGSCENDPLIPCPLPDRTQPATECSHIFATGTAVRLALTAQEVYFADACTYSTPVTAPPAGGAPDACAFVVAQDVTVTIRGEEAFR
jgi:hypothetical protein